MNLMEKRSILMAQEKVKQWKKSNVFCFPSFFSNHGQWNKEENILKELECEQRKGVKQRKNGEEWARPWLTSFWGCLWPQAELPPQMLSLFW